MPVAQLGWHVQYAGLSPGHAFLRDPKTLRAYDPDEVRVHLQIHHREFENLNAQAELARRDIAHLGAQVCALEAEGRRLGEALAEHEQARQQLLRHIQGLEQQVVDVKQSWSWRITAPLRAVWRLLR